MFIGIAVGTTVTKTTLATWLPLANCKNPNLISKPWYQCYEKAEDNTRLLSRHNAGFWPSPVLVVRENTWGGEHHVNARLFTLVLPVSITLLFQLLCLLHQWGSLFSFLQSRFSTVVPLLPGETKSLTVLVFAVADVLPLGCFFSRLCHFSAALCSQYLLKKKSFPLQVLEKDLNMSSLNKNCRKCRFVLWLCAKMWKEPKSRSARGPSVSPRGAGRLSVSHTHSKCWPCNQFAV